MMHLFYKMGFPAAVAHCNFGLRGEESDGDELLVKALCAQYGFDFYSKKFDVKAFTKQNTVSTQMAARTLRYEWFEKLRTEQHSDWIVTAHHANDSLETTLLNLVWFAWHFARQRKFIKAAFAGHKGANHCLCTRKWIALARGPVQ
jgi:tRNA(Ile)-lysidine synthase